MKRIALALIATTLPGAALADHGICIDPHYSYQAHYAGSGHDIIAKSTFGHDHRELRLSTTCIDLASAFHISLQTQFGCIGQGDSVFTTTIDGDRHSCIVTHVAPNAPAAAQHT